MRNKILSFTALLFLVFGCYRSDDLDSGVLNGSVSSNWKAPFFKATLNLLDIDEDSEFIITDPDGKIRLVFREDSIVEHSAESYFDLPPDQPQTNAVAIVGGGPLTFTFNFSTMAGARLNKLWLHEGFLHYEFPPSVAVGTVVHFVIDNADIHGTPASFDFEVTATSRSASFNVSGMFLDFTTTGPSVMSYSAEVISAPGLGFGDPVEFNWNFYDLSVQEIEGYFGNRVLALPPTSEKINLEGLNNFEGSVRLYEPEIKIKIWNPLGVGFDVIPVLSGIKNGKSTLVNLPPISVSPSPSQGVTEYTEIVFSASNSDIDKILEDLPTDVFLQGTIIVNPGQDSNAINFGSRDDIVIIGMELNIPLAFSAETLTLKHEMRNFNLLGNLPNNFNRLGVRIRSVNKFPFDASLKLVFKNKDNIRLDSIMVPVLRAANVDANGRVTNPVEYIYEADFEDESLDVITSLADVEVYVTIGTLDNGQTRVVIYDDYTFEAHVGFRAGLDIRIPNNED